MALFLDRRDAGRKLADRLAQSVLPPETVVLGLPRGGVPVAFEVARRLGAPLDVFVVRKLGVPGHPELAMGAIATHDVAVFNEALIRGLAIQPEDIAEVVSREKEELHRREQRYRGKGNGALDLEGRPVIVVDDGLATGATMSVAVKAIAKQNPSQIIVAVPVASGEAFRLLQGEVDQLLSYATPSPFFGVGAWYEDFTQTSDEEVHELLEGAVQSSDPLRIVEASLRRDDRRGAHIDDLVYIEADGETLHGDLIVSSDAVGLVVFAHGSGSSRHSERNRHVADVLRSHGVGTLLMDLLTVEEEYVDRHTRHLRFDIPLLARRVVSALDWIVLQPAIQHLPIGLFGASTGAAAALVAAAQRPDTVRCVVSRGGRPDLAGDALEQVRASTLLIVGGNDVPVIAMNQEAKERMGARVAMEIVPGATHLFVEPGALDTVATLAANWFHRYLLIAAEEEAPGRFS